MDRNFEFLLKKFAIVSTRYKATIIKQEHSTRFDLIIGIRKFNIIINHLSFHIWIFEPGNKTVLSKKDLNELFRTCPISSDPINELLNEFDLDQTNKKYYGKSKFKRILSYFIKRRNT